MDWNSRYIADVVRRALEEDIGTGDATTAAVVPPRASAQAKILARQTLVCAGLPIAEKVFRALDPEVRVTFPHNDGSFVEPGSEIVQIKGNARAILTGERTALNFLAHLCGVATLTRRFVEQLAGTRTRIRDTRKTTPGLRALEKYAVKTGGGSNHRFGLYDAILLKENHVALAGGMKEAVDKAHTYVLPKSQPPRAASAYDAAGLDPEVVGPGPLPVQIEVRNQKELLEALGAGAEAVLLDNMPLERGAKCKGAWRLAIDRVAVGGTPARIGRQSKRPACNRIRPGAGARYSDPGHAKATAERRPFRETHLSFFQDGLDESRGAGIGSCRGTGRRGRPGGRANRRTRARGTQVAFRTRGGNLCDVASSTEVGARAGSAADHDGRTLGTFRGAGRDRAEGGAKVAERLAYSREKSRRHPDGDARVTETSAIRV